MLTYVNTHHSFTKILKNSYKHKLTYIHVHTSFTCMSLLRKSLTHWQMCIFFHVHTHIFNYTCALTYKKYIYCYLQICSHLIMLLIQSTINIFIHIYTHKHTLPHTNKYHTFTYLHPQVRTRLYSYSLFFLRQGK